VAGGGWVGGGGGKGLQSGGLLGGSRRNRDTCSGLRRSAANVLELTSPSSGENESECSVLRLIFGVRAAPPRSIPINHLNFSSPASAAPDPKRAGPVRFFAGVSGPSSGPSSGRRSRLGSQGAPAYTRPFFFLPDHYFPPEADTSNPPSALHPAPVRHWPVLFDRPNNSGGGIAAGAGGGEPGGAHGFLGCRESGGGRRVRRFASVPVVATGAVEPVGLRFRPPARL